MMFTTIVLATVGAAAALGLATLTLTIWLLAYIGCHEDQTENVSDETAQRIALQAIERRPHGPDPSASRVSVIRQCCIDR